MNVELGQTYKDKEFHRIKGVAVARAEYLFAAPRVLLATVREGKIEGVWFEEAQLEVG